MKTIKIILKFCFVILFLFVFINSIGYLYAVISPKIDIKSANQIYIYDKTNEVMSTGSENKYWVSINDIDPLVIKATLSVEDKNFYKHNGFDFLRIAKAMISNITSGEIVQGASTITQQYAKNLFLDFDQTWSRKWKEMWLTYKLEAHYTKDEIIEGYLNTINYGHGIYGIGKASKYYFGKNIDELDLAEISILVGIPNSPSNYSPTSNFELAKKRQEIVLTRMLNNGYISKEEKDRALNEALSIVGKLDNYDLSSIMYYRDAVIDELKSLEEIPESYLETGGLKVYTYLDVEAQKALESGANINSSIENIQTAKVMMNANDGSIIALLGGVNYNNSTYNRASNSIRQPGSLVKPFLYYKALENGLTPSSLFYSSETAFNFENGTNYNPKNSGEIYANKEITMATALAYSDNIYAVKTHLFLGQSELYEMLRNVGINSDMDATASLALGSYGVSMFEITSAYASLANLGKTVTPHLIKEVYDINGNLLYKYDEDTDKQILNPSIVFLINEMLTGTYDTSMIDYSYPTCVSMISSLTNKYAIKSGSTDTDAWVIGYDKNIVLASWTGYDDNSEINNNIVLNNKNSWSTAMEEYFKGKEAAWYSIPSDVSGLLINPINGKIATENSKNKRIIYYLKGTEPTELDN